MAARASIVLVCAGLALVTSRAFAFAGEAITTNQTGDSISIVDLDALTVAAEIKIGGKPAGIALSADKTRAYIAAPEGREVIEVDLGTRKVTRRLRVGGGPLGIAAHPSKPEIYVADWYAHKIFVIDAAQFSIAAEIAVGQSPSGLDVTPDGKLLLSADRDSNAVSIIEIENRAVIATVPVGERPFGITIDGSGARAYTANVGSDDVSVVDISARKVVGSVKAGRRPYAVALAQGRGFVTDQYSGTITVFDAATLAVIKTVEACDHPEGIEAAPGGAVYVACWGDDKLFRLDPQTLEITGKVAVGSGPRAFGKFIR